MAAASGPVVTLTTLHSSKGLEFPVVYVAAVDQLDSAEEKRLEEMRLLYVGMTRATHSLHLSGIAQAPFTEHIERALERVKGAYH